MYGTMKSLISDGNKKKACLLGIVWLLLAGISLQGCDPVGRHKVLTFFFDGVPPLETTGSEAMDETASIAGEESIPDQEQPVEPEDGDASPALPVPSVSMVQHPPYAEKMCDGCHLRGAGGGNVFGGGFALIEEKTRLCGMCHDNMSQDELANTYTWLHAPVQYGACVECHHPHQSKHPFMLKGESIQKLCLNCHDGERLLNTEMHGEIGEMDCTECHNPHGSQERYLL